MFSTLVFRRTAPSSSLFDETEKNSLTSEDISELNEIMSELLDNEIFSKFINCVAVCVAKRSEYRTQYSRICVDGSEINLQNLDDFTSRLVDVPNCMDSITFCSFGLKFVDDLFYTSRRNSTRPSTLFQMFDIDRLADPKFQSIKDVNIDEELIGFRGSFICKSHILQIIKDHECRDDFHVSIRYFRRIIYIGKLEALLAIISQDGEMIVRWQTVKSILKKFGRDKTKEILNSLLHIFNEEYTLYSYVNSSKYINDFVGDLILHASSPYSNLDFPALKIFSQISASDPNNQDLNNVKSISTKFNQLVDLIQNKTQLNCSFSKFFSTFVQRLLEKIKNQVEHLNKQTISLCIKKLSIFSKHGWSVVTSDTEVKIALPTSNTWWYKDVYIVPDRYITAGTCFEIHENNRIVRINRLYISDAGNMRVEHMQDSATHPNYSSETCLGDLGRIRIYGSNDELEKDLVAAEKILMIINFDSAYSSEIYNTVKSKSKQITLATSYAVEQASSKSKNVVLRKAVPTQSNDEPEHLEQNADSPSLPSISNEVVIYANGNSNVNAQGFTTINPSPETSRFLTAVRDVERSRNNHFHRTSLLNDVRNPLWILPNGRSFITFSYTSEWGECFFYIKDRYSAPKLILDNYIVKDILAQCKILRCGTDKYIQDSVLYRLDGASKFRYHRDIQAGDRMIEKYNANNQSPFTLYDGHLIDRKVVNYKLIMDLSTVVQSKAEKLNVQV